VAAWCGRDRLAEMAGLFFLGIDLRRAPQQEFRGEGRNLSNPEIRLSDGRMP
jgi:hypothetical protein